MLLLLTLAALTAGASSSNSTFRPLYQWKTIDFDWTNTTKQEKIVSGEYIPNHVSISGIAFYNDIMFLTLPRYLPGNPVTLATVSLKDYPEKNEPSSPLLHAFPNWELNTPGDCKALQFVSNLAIVDGIAWILDVGRTDTVTQSPKNNCPPSLVIIDLNTADLRMERYMFPKDVVDYKESFFMDLVVDGDFAYITDNHFEDPGIVVFHRDDIVESSRSWKLRNGTYMKAQKDAETVRINGKNIKIQNKKSIDGIALSPKIGTGEEKKVYFSPLSSFHLYAVSTKYLRDERFSNNARDLRSVEFLDIGTKSSQTDGMKMDSNGTLYFGLIGDSALAAWDSGSNYNESKIVGNVSMTSWSDSFGIDSSDSVYVVTNKLYLVLELSENLSADEVNFVVWKMPTTTTPSSTSTSTSTTSSTTSTTSSTITPRKTSSSTPSTTTPITTSSSTTPSTTIYTLSYLILWVVVCLLL